MLNSVFISYRRDTSAFMARAIFQDLRAHHYDVFMDVESIDTGQFDTIILNQIAARPYFLLVLTPGTLDNCASPDDWVRREIETAIDHERIIIPVMTPNFRFEPYAEVLTGKLADLPRFNGLEVPHSYFDEAMERLRTRFLKPTNLTVKSPPKADLSVVMKKVAEAVAQTRITENQMNAQDHYERGLARKDDDFDGKLADYTEAINADPTFAQAFINRGLVRARMRNFSGAIDDLNEAIRLDPKNDRPYYERALLRSNIDDAIADYTEALRLNPQNALAYARRGFDRRTQGDLDGATADFERALELQPQHDLAPLIRSYVQRLKGDNP